MHEINKALNDLNVMREEFEQSITIMIEGMDTLNKRIERIEKWLLEENLLKIERSKIHTIDTRSALQRKPLNR